MAVGVGNRQGRSEDIGYISDESDFYGDQATKEAFERRAANFNALDWWINKLPSPTEIALSNLKNTNFHKMPEMHNVYEGRMDARQLSETIEGFVQRLPPQTTKQSLEIQWIWIANPYWKAPKAQGGFASEGPAETMSDWPQFISHGKKLLERLTGLREETERKHVGMGKGLVTREYNSQRDSLMQELRDIAVDLKCTTGKWMLFVDPSEINEVWKVVARYTARNEFGIAAKVAPDSGENKDRLICVYTTDFTDMKDVTRIAQKMKDVGLIDARKPIYYKPDAYTWLELNRGNQWDIKTSLFSSRDVLKGGGQTNMSAFFYKRKEMDEGPDKMEWE